MMLYMYTGTFLLYGARYVIFNALLDIQNSSHC